MVYLSVAYPFYFALNTEGTGRAMVLEIESTRLDKALFFPDEDFVVQGLAKTSQNIKKIHNDIRRRLEEYQQHWRLSINELGNCCYKGIIHKAAIKRACCFDPQSRPYVASLMLDPQISINNYANLRTKYKGLVAWMFGDTPMLPQSMEIELYSAWKSSDLPAALIPTAKRYKKQFERWNKESRDRTGIEVAKF